MSASRSETIQYDIEGNVRAHRYSLFVGVGALSYLNYYILKKKNQIFS